MILCISQVVVALEQDYEIITTEYDCIKTAMKTQLARFIQWVMSQNTIFSFSLLVIVCTRLNIFYRVLEQLNAFLE
jgi:DNA gyrase inhibitor GyrI